MTKYQKAVAYINDIECGLTQAEVAGINDDMVYIGTDTDDSTFRIHEDEVEYLAQSYDFYFANL